MGNVSYNVSSWESKGLANEKIKSFTVSCSSTAHQLAYTGDRIMTKFEGDCLKEDKVTYSHGPITNIYIVYQLNGSVTNSSVTLEKCLFGAVTLTKNHDIDKCKYSGYGVAFDSKGTFSPSSGGVGRNGIILGADMSSSVYANNKTRNILVLGKDFIQ